MPRRPMGVTRLTPPSCALTWARSAVLTNSACRSWVNGSSPVVRCWPAGSSGPTVRPALSPLRMRGCAARQRDPAAGARAAGVAPDDVADHDPPLWLHRQWACVAPGHQPSRRAAREAASNTSAAQPSASATSPTTSPDAYSKPADSDPDYTLDSEEPSYGPPGHTSCRRQEGSRPSD